MGEPSSGASHEEDQDHERDAGGNHGESNAKLRPFQLFLARQGGSGNAPSMIANGRGFSGIAFLQLRGIDSGRKAKAPAASLIGGARGAFSKSGSEAG